MAAHMRTFAWQPTSLGAPADWPSCLKTLVNLVLAHPTPTILLWGPELIQLYNDGYATVLGKKHPAAFGMQTRECWPEVWHINAPIYERVLGGGESVMLVDQLFPITRNGALENAYFTVTYVPAYGDVGIVSGVYITVTETTEKVDSRRRLASALIAGEVGTFEWDVESDRLYGDANFSRIFKIKLDETGAAPLAAYVQSIHPDDRDRVMALVNLTLDSHCDYEAEYRIVSGDGPMRWVIARGKGEWELGGRVLRFPGVVLDITERKAMEEELRRTQEEAEAANRAKDRFLAVLSHELRTPLTPVVMTIPAMQLDPDLPVKFRDDLAMLRRNIDLEVKLIDDLLDLSRVTSGKLRLQMQAVHVHEVLRHAIQNSQGDGFAKRIAIDCELDAQSDQITGDPARLQQVFWNLLRNAVKFTPEGGNVSVRTSNSYDGLHFITEVRDTGVGIASEILPRVFDAFEQGDARTTQQFGGLGLGLAIAKAVVEMHGGTISATSEGHNQGATFRVRLETTTHENSDETNLAVPPSTTMPNTGGFRILLVEDHPDTARALARLLRLSGYVVTVAHSVASALKSAAAERYDILVSDIGLPDATGYELMEQMRIRFGTKGIALSGYGMEEDMRRGREAGFVDHVVKPVNISQLEAVIRRVLAENV